MRVGRSGRDMIRSQLGRSPGGGGVTDRLREVLADVVSTAMWRPPESRTFHYRL
jgi:hypothetical protein